MSDTATDATIQPTESGLLLATDQVALEVDTARGLRIRDFRAIDGNGVFASLPDEAVVEVGDGRTQRLAGGHRLWIAPEIPARTYLPDDEPALVEQLADGRVALTQAAHPDFPIRRTITVNLRGAVARLEHTLVNDGEQLLQVAAWAITMVRRGGTAYLPLGRRDANRVQADRSIVLWPYTRLDDPDLTIEADTITIRMDRDTPLKIGTALTRGWLAYSLDDLVFVKRADHHEGPHADLGATGQVFVNHLGGELETLGPLVALEPGAATTHRETWEIHRMTAPSSSAVRELVER